MLAALVGSLGRAADGSAATPHIVGGRQTTAAHFPWQVALEMSNPGALCGGSILGPTEVLTAAHCVMTQEGTTNRRSPTTIKVLAGFNDLTAYVPGRTPPSGTQVVSVSRIRVHPYYNPQTDDDDVAVLTLATALKGSSTVKAIKLATAAPAPGQAATVSGYGQESNTNPMPNGRLYATQLSVLSDDDPSCAQLANVELNDAVLLCASAPTSATCHGDSGGPLVAGTPAVEVGLVNAGGDPCGSTPSTFVDVTAPEVRDFITGSAAPPVAPRATAVPQLFGWSPSFDSDTLTCNPGTWSGSPTSVGYSFEPSSGTLATPLQAGASNAFTPGAARVGQSITCTVVASNAGGTSVLRTGATPPVVADTTPPIVRIASRRCARGTCTFAVQVADPPAHDAVALSSLLSYRTTKKVICHRRRHRHRRRTRCTVHVTRLQPVSVSPIAAGTYRVIPRKVPYGVSTLGLVVTDVVGNHRTVKVRVKVKRPKKKKRRR